jgi:hypothetical protein
VSLVNTDTGEFVAMNEADARELIDGLKRAVTIAENQIIRAWEGRAWLALGYESWDEMVAVEFKTHYLKIAPDERRQAAIEMAKVGMSTRAIGSALGVSHQTAANDISGVKDLTPVIGTDGKTYTKHEPIVAPGQTATAGAGVEQSAPAPAPLLTAVEMDDAEENAQQVALGHLLNDIANDPEQVRLQTQGDVIKACRAFRNALLIPFDPQAIADLLDDDAIESVASLERSLHQWLLTARNSRSGLRLVKGKS